MDREKNKKHQSKNMGQVTREKNEERGDGEKKKVRWSASGVCVHTVEQNTNPNFTDM